MIVGLPPGLSRPIWPTMRRFFHLLTLVALLFAPLVAPAAAMAAASAPTDCADMSMGEGGHDMPAADHGIGEACCIAVPPAIDPPVVAFDVAAAPDHRAFIALTEPFRLGAGPNAEDPPPRIA